MTSKQEIVDLILDKLNNNKDELVRQWQNPQGTKTRHFLIDNLLPSELCTSIYNAFPKDGDDLHSTNSFREKKRATVNVDNYEAVLCNITYAIQDGAIVNLVGKICGFDGLEPDPQLYAGGVSLMTKDDFLNPHLDNSHDGKRTKYRRLNLLYYVSPEWKTENGGSLELWDESRTTPKTLTAFSNRLVVMETNKTSWHSVSKVQVDSPRCCVSNYYFSEFSPDNTDYFHVTLFSGRPEQKMRQALSKIDNALRGFVSKTLKISRKRMRNDND